MNRSNTLFSQTIFQCCVLCLWNESNHSLSKFIVRCPFITLFHFIVAVSKLKQLPQLFVWIFWSKTLPSSKYFKHIDVDSSCIINHLVNNSGIYCVYWQNIHPNWQLNSLSFGKSQHLYTLFLNRCRGSKFLTREIRHTYRHPAVNCTLIVRLKACILMQIHSRKTPYLILHSNRGGHDCL
jgi:hypothetical protein